MCREPFVDRFNAPNTRSRQTMEFFGRAIEIPELGGWPRGVYEGRSADEVKPEMARLILNPDMVPPGLSPASGQRGKSWNQAMKPMFKRIMEMMDAIGDSRRGFVITSGGQLQAIDALAKAGFPEHGEFDRSDLANQPYWSVTGKLFRLTRKGLSEAKNNAEMGLYLAEHAETWWNWSRENRQ